MPLWLAIGLAIASPLGALLASTFFYRFTTPTTLVVAVVVIGLSIAGFFIADFWINQQTTLAKALSDTIILSQLSALVFSGGLFTVAFEKLG